jgi:hypothetical protein
MSSTRNVLPSLCGLNINTVHTDGGAEKRGSDGDGATSTSQPPAKVAKTGGPEISEKAARTIVERIQKLSPGDIRQMYLHKVQTVTKKLKDRRKKDAARRAETKSMYAGMTHAQIFAMVEAEVKPAMISRNKFPAPGSSVSPTANQQKELDERVMDKMQQIARDFRYEALRGVQDFPADRYGLLQKYAREVDFSNVEPRSETHQPAARIPGVMVVPILTDPEVENWRTLVQQAMDSFPEFRPASQFNRVSNVPSELAGDFKFVAGGFSALANPSSFHHPIIRALRALVYNRLLEVDKSADDGSGSTTAKSVFGFWDPDSENYGRMLEKLSDRLMYRRIDKAPPAESWHRDDALGVDSANPSTNYPADVVYGGWLNLDVGHDQHFSCIPYSASTTTRTGSGFGTIKSKVYDESGKPHDRVEMLEWIKHMYRVQVPPGHLLIFDEMTIHEVLATEKPFDSMRLFFGWRVSGRNSQYPVAHSTDPPIRPMIWNLDQRLDEQQSMPIKSGQHNALDQEEILKELEAKAKESQPTDEGAALHLLNHYKKVYTKNATPIYPCGPNFTTDNSWGMIPPNAENGIINACVKHLNPYLLGIRHFQVDSTKITASAQKWENLADNPTANEKAYAQLRDQLNARVNNSVAFHRSYESSHLVTKDDGTQHRVANGTLADLYDLAARPKSVGGGGVVCMKTQYFDSLKTMQEKFGKRDPRMKMYEPYSELDRKVHKPQNPHEMLGELQREISTWKTSAMEL